MKACVLDASVVVKWFLEILTLLEEAPIEWCDEASLLKGVFRLATELDRTVYDSVYLALAVRRECSLVTADRRFYNAISASRLARSIVWVENVV
ncbi:MAG TPA: type II toxin-antitoxin system VapC family toxin [Thermoanaerobaculia bacterium]|nr:type II toxin-antitoxin system VapC family toxin [Thermoanaerobaculia bacterium]